MNFSLSHRDYAAIAFPFILSAVTLPLLGAVDTAVVGRLESSAYIGGVAIGSLILNTLYWMVGFFRVATTGQSAIALGDGIREHLITSLVHPALIATSCGMFFVLIQSFIWLGVEWLFALEPAVAEQAHLYFRILIWGAPLVLLNYVVVGWLMGQAKAKQVLYVQVSGNALNIILDLLFVLVFEWGVAGVAVATLLAQICTLSFGMYIAGKTSTLTLRECREACRISKDALANILTSNLDLFIRTLCPLVVYNVMAKMGASLGTDTLATNAVLMQVIFFVSHIYDGVASTSSVFAGKALGENNVGLLRLTLQRNLEWTVGFMVILATILTMLGKNMGYAFTDIAEVLENFAHVYHWSTVFALVAGFGLTIYGVFTGTNTTRPLRNSTLLALLSFLLGLGTIPFWGNDGLWFAFMLFYIGRGAYLVPYMKYIYAKFKA